MKRGGTPGAGTRSQLLGLLGRLPPGRKARASAACAAADLAGVRSILGFTRDGDRYPWFQAGRRGPQVPWQITILARQDATKPLGALLLRCCLCQESAPVRC